MSQAEVEAEKQRIVMHYQNLRGEVQSLAQKINELEAEHHEHG